MISIKEQRARDRLNELMAMGEPVLDKAINEWVKSHNLSFKPIDDKAQTKSARIKAKAKILLVLEQDS